MNSIEKLIQIFSQFPGIGPRQARRFVYYLLTRNNGTLEELSENIKDLKNDVVMCTNCQRFFQKNNGSAKLCKICADQTRDHSVLMIVQRDADLESVEKNGSFNGIYFVLGGSVPILEKEPEKRIRIKELIKFIQDKINPTSQSFAGLKEIILGVNWNPEGENTGDYVKREIESILKNVPSTSAASFAQGSDRSKKASVDKVKISHLGKGLSMGTELEYVDSDTMKNALKNRS